MAKAKKEKKEKKSKIKKIATPKRIAIVSAIITFVAFAYKFTLGILATSLVMLIAAFPTLFIFICKAVFVKNLNQTEAQKKKAYLIMTIATFSFTMLFIMFSTLKVGGIDITNSNRFEGWIGLIFIFFIIVMFVLSIINLRGALEKTDILAIGLREMSFVSALTDAAMIQEFSYRVILKYLHLPFMNYINQYFPFGVSMIMLIVTIIMIIRCVKYLTKKDEKVEIE